jgi:MFS family permease
VAPANGQRPWLSRAVVGIVAATFFSDVGHEMVTAVLPLYLASAGLGAAALGVMEGLADLLFSLSKLAGGYIGHRVERKRPWGAAGYLATALGTGALAFANSAVALVSLRAVAWFGRGFRSPLRDFILADAVEPTHFGRAYGVERTSDMIGAVAGPLLALFLVGLGCDLRVVLLVSVAPSLLAVVSFFAMTRDKLVASADGTKPRASTRLPRAFWAFVIGVFLFGLGDFSRTFLILLASRALGSDGSEPAGSLLLTGPVLLYAMHNLVSAVAAYPAGRAGDRGSKLRVLLVGYVLGVLTNGLLAWASGSVAVLMVAIALSGVYIAILETIEKAVAAELLPREQRSLGFGVLASANAVGDMVSSVVVGVLLDAGQPTLAFGLPTVVNLLGVVWLVWFMASRPAQHTS